MASLQYRDQLHGHRGDQSIIIATDASVTGCHTGSGYIATNGNYGINAYHQPAYIAQGSEALIAELRAVFYAVERYSQEKILVLCDAQAAVEYLFGWQQGGNVFPKTYDQAPRSDGSKPRLVQLAELIAAAGDRIRVRWIKGHNGHPLNEAADQLAKLGLKYKLGQVTQPGLVYQARACVLRTLYAPRPLPPKPRSGQP